VEILLVCAAKREIAASDARSASASARWTTGRLAQAGMKSTWIAAGDSAQVTA